MVARSVETVLRGLNEARVRYLVVGGLAVVAHGYVRLTQDIDIVLALDRENVERAMGALELLGFRPLVPVRLDEFADEAKRALWVREKSAKVFQVISDDYPTVRVDLFLQQPFDFDEAYSRASWQELSPEVHVPFVGFDDLIAMKRLAGRSQDLLDIARLQEVHRLTGSAPGVDDDD